jgi:hypothetical protein
MGGWFTLAECTYLITLTLVLLAVGDIPKMRLASRLVIFASNPPL